MTGNKCFIFRSYQKMERNIMWSFMELVKRKLICYTHNITWVALSYHNFYSYVNDINGINPRKNEINRQTFVEFKKLCAIVSYTI